MNAYVVLLTYLKPLEKIMEAVPAHREYLNLFYEKGIILFSGMQRTQKGGVIIMKAEKDSEVEALIQNDPLNTQGLASYDFITFDIRRHQPYLEEWLQGKSH